MTAYIYQIRNLVNDKIYVGQTTMIKTRKRQHFSDLRCKRHGNIILQRAFEKHGEQNFVFEIVSVIEGNQKDIDDAEIKIIASVSKEQRYNISEGGGAFMKNRKHTLETRMIMSKLRIGKKHSESSILKMSNSSKGLAAGEKSGRAKLTEEQVREIKFVHIPNGLGCVVLGKMYNVNNRTISEIKRGKNWKHVLESTA